MTIDITKIDIDRLESIKDEMRELLDEAGQIIVVDTELDEFSHWFGIIEQAIWQGDKAGNNTMEDTVEMLRNLENEEE